jgi:hypothetical protein
MRFDVNLLTHTYTSLSPYARALTRLTQRVLGWQEEEVVAAGELVDGLPEFSKADVKAHTSVKTGIWVRGSECR